MRRAIVLALAALGALANIAPAFASTCPVCLAGTNHNETFMRDTY
jgi:hypothetical protein